MQPFFLFVCLLLFSLRGVDFFLNTGLVGHEAKRNVLSQLRDKRKSDLKERPKLKFGKILHTKRVCHVLFNL